MLGNTTPDDAQKLAANLAKGLSLKGTLSALPIRSEATLPPGRTLWSIDSTDVNDPNHAVRLAIQLKRSMEDDAMLNLLDKVLSPKFFDVLRTQQQLGYIVGMGPSVGVAFSYLLGQVQTEFPAEYTRSRIDAFLDEHFLWIEKELTEEEFQTCRAGLLAELKQRPKNLHEEASHWQRAFTNRTFDFERRAKMIQFLEDVASREGLISFLKEKVLTAPRLYIQVKKVLDKQDKALPDGAVVPEDPADIRRWSGPADAVVKDFESSAVWVSSETAAKL